MTYLFFYGRKRLKEKGEKKNSFRELNSRLYISTCIIIQPSADTRSLESFRLGHSPQIPVKFILLILHDPYLIHHHHLYSTLVTISSTCASPFHRAYFSSTYNIHHTPIACTFFFPFIRMLHNLFHFLPCTTLGIQTSSLCRYDPQHTICGTTILWIPLNKYTHSFLSRYLVFWHHRFNACTHSLSQKFILLESLISGPIFSLLLPVYLLSSPQFFFLYSIHTYISNYHWYDILRICVFPPFFSDIQNRLHSLHSFLNRHICEYCFYFFAFK